MLNRVQVSIDATIQDARKGFVSDKAKPVSV